MTVNVPGPELLVGDMVHAPGPLVPHVAVMGEEPAFVTVMVYLNVLRHSAYVALSCPVHVAPPGFEKSLLQPGGALGSLVGEAVMQISSFVVLMLTGTSFAFRAATGTFGNGLAVVSNKEIPNSVYLTFSASTYVVPPAAQPR